jgi:hypothetical protein
MKKLLTRVNQRYTLLASALLCAVTSTSLFAHEQQSCEVDLTAGLTINTQYIEFFADQSNEEDKPTVSLYKIVDGNQLIVGDKAVHLTPEQQLLVGNYADSIRTLIPQVKSLAIEGVDLAREGVDLAFTKLLGAGNSVGRELSQELLLIRKAVDDNLSLEKGINFGHNGNNNSNVIIKGLMGEDFEQRIESAVEKAVMNSIGSLLVALGKEMLNSDGDSDTFETRMENFGDNIANEMEARAKIIERKAEKLCVAVQEIDQLEDKLKVSVDEVASFDVLTTKLHSSHHYDDDEESKRDNKLM